MTSSVYKVANGFSAAVNGALPSIEEVISKPASKVFVVQIDPPKVQTASKVLGSQAYIERMNLFKQRATHLFDDSSRISTHEAEFMRGIRNGIESTQYFGKLQSVEEKPNYIHVIPDAQKYQSTPQGSFQFHMDLISPTASEHPLPRALTNFITYRTEDHAAAVTKAFDDISESSAHVALRAERAKVPGSHRQEMAAATLLPPPKRPVSVKVKAPPSKTQKASGWKRSTPSGTAWGEPPPYKGVYSQRDNPIEEIERLSTLRSRAEEELKSHSDRLNHINLTRDGVPGERGKLEKRIADQQGYIDRLKMAIDFNELPFDPL